PAARRLVFAPSPRICFPPALDSPAAEAEDARCVSPLAVRGSRARHGVHGLGRPALGGPVYPGVSCVMSGPSAHGTYAHAVDLSARVYAGLGVAVARQSSRAESVRTGADQCN